MKSCFKCKELKSLDLFYKHKGTADGHLGKCKECAKKYSKAHVKDNLEKHRMQNNRWYAKNIEKAREMGRRANKKNSATVNANTARHRAAKLSASPLWLTKEHKIQIKFWYVLAKELRWLSEERLEVDHIIPLQGKDVCGLHVPWNLQLLPKSINVKKHNKVF